MNLHFRNDRTGVDGNQPSQPIARLGIAPRRRFIAWATLCVLLGAASGIPTGLALSQMTHQMHVETLLSMATSEIPRPANLEVRQDHWDPGAETGMHQHPGPVILAVLEGELIEETKAGRITLSSGQVVWRAARQEHNVRNESDKPARVLAIHFDPMQ